MDQKLLQQKKNVRKVGEVRKDNTCDFYPELVDYSYEKRDAIKMIPCRVHNCSCEEYNPVDPTLSTKPLDGCSNCSHVKFLHTALNHKPEKPVKIKDDDKDEENDNDEDDEDENNTK